MTSLRLMTPQTHQYAQDVSRKCAADSAGSYELPSPGVWRGVGGEDATRQKVEAALTSRLEPLSCRFRRLRRRRLHLRRLGLPCLAHLLVVAPPVDVLRQDHLARALAVDRGIVDARRHRALLSQR